MTTTTRRRLNILFVVLIVAAVFTIGLVLTLHNQEPAPTGKDEVFLSKLNSFWRDGVSSSELIETAKGTCDTLRSGADPDRLRTTLENGTHGVGNGANMFDASVAVYCPDLR